MRTRAGALAVALLWWLGGSWAWAQTYGDTDRGKLAKALDEAKVSLQRGLTVSEGTGAGRPVSGKFELENGALQLSIYTVRGEKFSEVIVDHKTGKVAKVQAITGGEDLTAAETQSEAMSKAKRSLRVAIDQAIKSNTGYRAVSVTPRVRDGHLVAEIALVKGDDFKTVWQKLD